MNSFNELKKEFLDKHNLIEEDWNNLVRFEKYRRSGVANVYEYFGVMIRNNVNGGQKMVDFIQSNYDEFEEVYIQGEQKWVSLK